MRQKSLPMAFFSKVAFPVIYQVLFTYFMLLASVGHSLVQELLILLAVLGIPMTARFNAGMASYRLIKRNGWTPIQPFIVTWLVPLLQVLVFAKMA